MKIIYTTLTSLFITTTASALPGVPDGTYTGKGSMRTEDSPATLYDATLTLSGTQMIAGYTYPNGRQVDYTADTVITTGDRFDIKVDGKSIGSGYCEDTMCHLDIPEHEAEETIIFHAGKLLRIGSMKHGNVTLTYSETLTPK